MYKERFGTDHRSSSYRSGRAVAICSGQPHRVSVFLLNKPGEVTDMLRVAGDRYGHFDSKRAQLAIARRTLETGCRYGETKLIHDEEGNMIAMLVTQSLRPEAEER